MIFSASIDLKIRTVCYEIQTANNFWNQIKRNVTIENLKGENDDLKRRLDRIDKDYKKAVEQRDQFHIEAQQAADSSMLEQQLDDYRDRVDSLEQSTRDKDDQIHQVRNHIYRWPLVPQNFAFKDSAHQ